MGSFVKGDVVVFPFPFSDLSDTKRRPALVLADLSGDDLILCMITKSSRDTDSISVSDADFSSGKLNQLSNIRANRLFTGDANLIYYSAGKLKPAKVKEVVDKLIDILNRT
jgi:mRNA interferase MazF